MMMMRNLGKIAVFGGLLTLMALPEAALAQRRIEYSSSMIKGVVTDRNVFAIDEGG